LGIELTARYWFIKTPRVTGKSYQRPRKFVIIDVLAYTSTKLFKKKLSYIGLKEFQIATNHKSGTLIV